MVEHAADSSAMPHNAIVVLMGSLLLAGRPHLMPIADAQPRAAAGRTSAVAACWAASSFDDRAYVLGEKKEMRRLHQVRGIDAPPVGFLRRGTLEDCDGLEYVHREASPPLILPTHEATKEPLINKVSNI